MTKRQKDVLDFVAASIAANRYSPSYQEIADGVGLKSASTVYKHLQGLLRQGLLTRLGWRYRSTSLTKRGKQLAKARKCPHCGGAL